MVPPSAARNSPVAPSVAPVNAPRLCPKSSASASSRGSAAQLKRMNGWSARGDPSTSARATSSLPVPLSPTTRTVTSRAATRSTNEATATIGSDSKTICFDSASRARSCRFSDARPTVSRQRRTTRTMSDASNGFEK